MQKAPMPINTQKGNKLEVRVGDFGPNGERIDKTDIKLRIFLQPDTSKP